MKEVVKDVKVVCEMKQERGRRFEIARRREEALTGQFERRSLKNIQTTLARRGR
jgi:hypothetical protein